ncbi:MAG: macro domain-containing protein, partial [Phycisphaeraceae bacterium]
GIRHLIHTVGPVWHGDESEKLGNNREDVLLASCYMRSLDLAREHDCRSVAFPAISTGVYGFPKERAAKIAFGHVAGYLGEHAMPGEVIFCCFSDTDAAIYREVIGSRAEWMFNRKRA